MTKPARVVDEAVAVAEGTGFVGVGVAVTAGLDGVDAGGVLQAKVRKAAAVKIRVRTFIHKIVPASGTTG